MAVEFFESYLPDRQILLQSLIIKMVFCQFKKSTEEAVLCQLR